MGDLTVPAAAVAGAAILLATVAVLFAVRRLVLARVVGSFDCSVRTVGGRRAWSVGVARYGDDRIDWFRIFSLSLRPSRTWQRCLLEVVGTRAPKGPETFAVLPGVRIVQCRYDGADLALAMSADAHTGLTSWLEAAPPGQVTRVT